MYEAESLSVDIKAFVLGAACGIAIYAIAQHVVREERPPIPVETQSNLRGSTVSSAADETGPTATHKSDRQTLLFGLQVGEGDRTNELDASMPPESPGQREEPIDSERAQPEQEKRRKGTTITPGMDTTKLWLDRAYSKLQSQPRNESWAYDMEIAIQQFLATHQSIGDFELGYVECRSTLCQIKAIGFDESTGPTWQRVMFDMTQQPWYAFGQTASSWSRIDDRLLIIHDLYTTPTPADE